MKVRGPQRLVSHCSDIRPELNLYATDSLGRLGKLRDSFPEECFQSLNIEHLGLQNKSILLKRTYQITKKFCGIITYASIC